VTKDRRLGRGLAALLGTPLEEDGILENGGGRMVEEIPMGAGKATSLKTFSPAVHSSAEAADMSQLSGNRSRTASSRLTAYDANPAAVGVTGSVPLPGRTTAKRTTPSNPTDGDSVPGPTSTDNPLTIQSIEINVSDIENNPFQPRRRFNETEIASLAESIREHEQLQPILVRRVGDRYQLISGERRLRATIHAGRTKIRAEVREADDRLVAELAIVENLQRKDLDPIEKAMSFRRYIDEHQCAQEDLARRLKIDRSTIANLMRLLELPDDLQIHVQNGKLTSGHARTLLPLGHEDEQRQFAAQIMDEGWTVRETERRVAAHLLEQDSQAKARPNANRSGPRKRDTPHVAALEQQIRLSLGTKAEIRQQKTGRGKIVINFNNPEEFERLFAIICPQSTVPTPE